MIRRWMSVTFMTIVPLAAVFAGGCAQLPAVTANPIEITAGEYDRVFDASIQTLRQMRFTVDRKDRRFGVVTSEPMLASSAIEPWYRDNTHSAQVAQSTLHLQRRIVRVELTPAEPVADARTEAYRMSVQVQIERRYDPPKELNTPLIGAARFRDVRQNVITQTTEAGTETSHWVNIGRDEQLEQRLIAQILTRATHGESAPQVSPETPAVEKPADAKPAQAVPAAQKPAETKPQTPPSPPNP